MKLGTRITLSTTALVMAAFAVFGLVSVRIRRAELVADLERHTQSIGKALRVALEAALQEGLYEDVRKLVLRLQEADTSIGIAYLELKPQAQAPAVDPSADSTDRGGDGGARTGPGTDGDGGVAEVIVEEDEEGRYVAPAPDPVRDARVRRMLIALQPVDEHVQRGGKSIYAYTLPIADEQSRIVAAIDITRDESDAERALADTERTVALTVLLVGGGLVLLVWLTTRGAISSPLQRLVEGIDEVAHGDLTRAILREREDEIGDLADRFNQMTANLREARSETERGIEARVTLESRLRQSEKLATIGQLAAQIAHEVGTPLGVIGGRARTMEKKAVDPVEVAKNAGIIAVQATRITKIIQRLLDFARAKVATKSKVDLSSVARDTIDFLEHQLAASNVSARILPFAREEGAAEVPDEPCVVADADQLQQVCLNLCLNAIQAMPSGGTLELSTRAVLRRKPGLDLAPPGRYVVLEVADDGPGVPVEDRERIFEAFYSTRHGDGGTGLGLAVSMGIVKDHDGWIAIAERVGGGSCFQVFLPAPDADDAGPADESAAAVGASDDRASSGGAPTPVKE